MEHTWIHCHPYAPLPPNAVVGGHDCDGSPIYVGRSFHEGDHLPAKVVPSKGCAYVCWGGEEHTKTHYEILAGQNYTWVSCYGSNVPAHAVRSGSTKTGEPLYVGRAHHANSLVVGKIQPSHGCLYIPFGGREIRVHTYEVLVHEQRAQWLPSAPNYVPPMAVVAGHDVDSAPVYVGRAQHEEHRWVHSSVHSCLPPEAVVGGNDADGDVMYVGRAFHGGDMLVAKVIPAKKRAYVSWRGQEIPKEEFEILCGDSFGWRQVYDHSIPENAVKCGTTAVGQDVFIGRGHFEGSLTVGRVSSVHRSLFIPFGGMERRLDSYEILVDQHNNNVGWVITENIKVGPSIESKPPPYTPVAPPPPPQFGGSQVPPQQLLPPPPQFGGSQYPPQQLPPTPQYHGSTQPHDTWINAGPTYTPTNAVQAGHDLDMSPILVCRAFHNGALIPGKAVTGHSCGYICSDGQELPKPNYEILVGHGYNWIPSRNGVIPPGAVKAGRTACGEPLFVGRARYNGSLTPGKVQPSHNCLYIPFGGREVRLMDYEILVRTEANPLLTY